MMSRKPKPAEVKEAASRHADEAVQTLLDLMRNSSSDPVRVAAARELLDRAHGKPKTETAGGGDSLADMINRAYTRSDP